MSKFNFPLIDDLEKSEYPEFIPSIIECLNKIHEVKSDETGILAEQNKINSWRDYISSRYSDDHEWFKWHEIEVRDGIHTELVRAARKKIKGLYLSVNLPTNNYSLIHTDVNQKNFFIDPTTNQVAGVIDWSESMFGDPLYDFARLHLFIIHHGLGEDVLNDLFETIQMNPEDQAREELYFYSIVLDYLNWYSEDIDEFNLSRIKLHQGLLREWVNQ